jgi:hypothetical protein
MPLDRWPGDLVAVGRKFCWKEVLLEGSSVERKSCCLCIHKVGSLAGDRVAKSCNIEQGSRSEEAAGLHRLLR